MAETRELGVSHTESRCGQCQKLYQHPPTPEEKTPCCQSVYWPIHELPPKAGSDGS